MAGYLNTLISASLQGFLMSGTDSLLSLSIPITDTGREIILYVFLDRGVIPY